MRPGKLSLTAVFLVGLLTPASAQSGTLDTTFGSDGVATGSTPSFARDIAIDRRERFVFVGVQSPFGIPSDAFIGRLLADGTTDPSFNGTGALTIPVDCPAIPRTILEAVDVAGNDVIAAGQTGCRRGIVVRVRENGTPDPTFGTDGVFHYAPDAASRSSAFFGVDVAPDGTVVAVGKEERDDPGGEVRTYLVVLRLTPAGEPDTDFGTGGVVRLRVSDDLLPDSQLNDLVIFPDGRVLATGHVSLGGIQTVVVRLNVNGTPDATFEGGGLVVHDLGAGVTDAANSVLYGPDGAVYLSGTVALGNRFGFLAARLRYDGTRDPSFGVNGVSIVDALDGASCVSRDAVLDLDGRLAMAGDCGQSTTLVWAIARILPGGELDSSFGMDGVVRPAAPGPSQSLYGIARQPDGRLVAAGHVLKNGIPVWALTRLHAATTTTTEPTAGAGPDLEIYPNPVVAGAQVRFSVEAAAETALTVYDALGRQVTHVEAGLVGPGAHERSVDLSSLTAGVYTVRLRAGSAHATRTITVR